MSGKKYSLATTLFVLSGVLISAAAGAISWFSYQQSSAMLMKEFDLRAETIATSFAYQAYEGIIVQDDYILNNVCEGVLQEANVSYLQIYDRNGTLLYALYKEMEDRSDAPSPQRIEDTGFVSGQIKKRIIGKDEIGGSFSVLDVRRAVHDRYITDKIVGYVRIGVSLAEMLNLKKRLILSSALIFLAVLAAALGASIIFARKLSRSLNGVIAAMRNIVKHQDLSERIQQDEKIVEISEIQVCFNLMTDKLETSQEALKENGHRLRLALQAIDAGVWDWDITTGKVDFSERWATMLGYAPNEIKRHVSTWEKLILPDDMPEVMDTLNAHLKGRLSIYQIEHRLLTKSGEWKWILDTGQVVARDEKGNPLRAIGTHIDIDQRKRNELELEKYRENLEQMVEERTAELKKALMDLQNTQSQLIQSEKMASIGQLAAGVAHEINNPVGFVKSNLGSMNEYREDLTSLLDEYRTLETALQQDERVSGNGAIQKAIENIRKVKDEIDISFILDDYKNVINESLEGMARVAKIVADLKDVWNELKYKAEVIKDLGDIPPIECYPQRLNQVFMNILVNAAQAIENKGEIRITTRADNEHVEIKISDTGTGIPPDVLPKIFDPFFTTKDVGKGTGLGLNMAYNIIQKHKGTIDVESEAGKGTTFIIRLQIEPDIEV
jgi:PAS domain S-box-containing protein